MKLENLNDDAMNLVAVLNGEIIGQAGIERQRGRRAHAAIVGLGVHDDHHRPGHRIGAAARTFVDAARQLVWQSSGSN